MQKFETPVIVAINALESEQVFAKHSGNNSNNGRWGDGNENSNNHGQGHGDWHDDGVGGHHGNNP
ncbi:MAG: hypothetical protein IK080_03115 [Clostridia bacterium]|nr:hypothetical protein [Clostridia bacterium]